MFAIRIASTNSSQNVRSKYELMALQTYRIWLFTRVSQRKALHVYSFFFATIYELMRFKRFSHMERLESRYALKQNHSLYDAEICCTNLFIDPINLFWRSTLWLAYLSSLLVTRHKRLFGVQIWKFRFEDNIGHSARKPSAWILRECGDQTVLWIARHMVSSKLQKLQHFGFRHSFGSVYPNLSSNLSNRVKSQVTFFRKKRLWNHNFLHTTLVG